MVRIHVGQPGTILRLALPKQNLTVAGAVLYLPNDVMKFYYVYVLHNPQKDFVYIGYSENLRSRISYHNDGKVQSTKAYLPLKLIHYEAYKSKADAKRREFYLKSNRGKTTLTTMLKEYFSGNR